MVAAIVRDPFRDHRLERCLIGHAVLDRCDGPVGGREDIRSRGQILLDLLAVAVEDPAVFDPGPVDREGFGGLDAAAVYRDP